MRVIGYVRASTAEQDQGAGLEAQRKVIAAECERRAWELVRVAQDIANGGR